MKRFAVFTVAALAGLLALPAWAQNTPVGPLVELSRPNAVGTCDDGFSLPGTWTLNDADEPFVAVNPVHPNNIVATWWQGPLQNVVAAVSLDAGQTWQKVPIPFTVCSGGAFLAAGDERLAFAPNGDLYAFVVLGNSLATTTTAVSKSTDGGLHWSLPILQTNTESPNDITVITADPTDTQFLYAVWDGTAAGKRGTAVFTRTTDGGATWEPGRPIVQPDPQSFVQFSQILVLPDGTLVDIFEFYQEQPNKPITFTNLQVLRSTDHGQTWSAPINAVTMTPLYRPNGNSLLIDPETGQFVHDVTNPSFAIDTRNGNLYAVWEDGRFSNFQYNDIAFSMSADGGFTWSAPVRVNQTPLNIPLLNRQSFLPAVAVTANGTIGVSYYDFRFNDPSPGLPTDYWLAQCQPSSTLAASDLACWGKEVRLTDSSFNMEAVHSFNLANGDFWLGDYFGLVGTDHGFVSTFTQVDSQNITSIFARSVGP